MKARKRDVVPADPCIYCGSTKPRTKREHVMSQALGKFKQNWTLTCVCDECNMFFSKELELPLLRTSVRADGGKGDPASENSDPQMASDPVQGPKDVPPADRKVALGNEPPVLGALERQFRTANQRLHLAGGPVQRRRDEICRVRLLRIGDGSVPLVPRGGRRLSRMPASRQRAPDTDQRMGQLSLGTRRDPGSGIRAVGRGAVLLSQPGPVAGSRPKGGSHRDGGPGRPCFGGGPGSHPLRMREISVVVQF